MIKHSWRPWLHVVVCKIVIGIGIFCGGVLVARQEFSIPVAYASTISVTGAATLSSTLSVSGASTLTGALTANGGITATTGSLSSTLSVAGTTTIGSSSGYQLFFQDNLGASQLATINAMGNAAVNVATITIADESEAYVALTYLIDLGTSLAKQLIREELFISEKNGTTATVYTISRSAYLDEAAIGMMPGTQSATNLSYGVPTVSGHVVTLKLWPSSSLNAIAAVHIIAVAHYKGTCSISIATS